MKTIKLATAVLTLSVAVFLTALVTNAPSSQAGTSSLINTYELTLAAQLEPTPGYDTF